MIRSLLILSLFALPASAYEVDNFTQRYEPLKDSREQLNIETNRHFAKAIAKLNADSKNKSGDAACNKKDLYNYIEDSTGAKLADGGGYIGIMEKYACDPDNKVPRHDPVKNHIYSLRTTEQKMRTYMMTMAGLNCSINVNGVYIGADKLGHLFDEGYSYYVYAQRAKAKGASIQDATLGAINSGEKDEEGELGLATCGIKSHADLSTNYAGYLFWNSLADGPSPYFQCVQGEWKQIRYFDWADYVNNSWDEAINCNEPYSEEFGKVIQKQQMNLESGLFKGKNRYQCPVSPKQCMELKKSLGDKAPLLLSKVCLNVTQKDVDEKEPKIYSKQQADTSYSPPKMGYSATSPSSSAKGDR